MKAILTGCGGFIGSNLADKLIELGWEVEGWDNLSTGKIENVHPNVKFRNLDVNHLHFLGDLIYEKIDVIFHLAALARIQPSFEKPVDTCDNNIMGTVNVLEHARKTGAKVVYAGSSSFYHDPLVNPYSFSKWIGEEVCKMYNKVYNVPVAITRFFNVYGQRQLEEGAYATVIGIFEKQFREGKPLTVTGTGKKRRDFTHVNDIVNGLIAAAGDNWNADVFNFGTSYNYSILQVAKMFSDNIEFIPDRPGEAQETCADISYTQKMLGWRPKYSLEEYIEDIVKDVFHVPELMCEQDLTKIKNMNRNYVEVAAKPLSGVENDVYRLLKHIEALNNK